MFTAKRFNQPAAAATMSLVLVLGAFAAAPMSSAHAEDLHKLTIRVDAPRVTDDTIAKVEPGMSQSDIEQLIGEPARTGHFPLSNTNAWDYDFRDSWGYPSTFSVIFNDADTVVSKASVRKNY